MLKIIVQQQPLLQLSIWLYNWRIRVRDSYNVYGKPVACDSACRIKWQAFEYIIAHTKLPLSNKNI